MAIREKCEEKRGAALCPECNRLLVVGQFEISHSPQRLKPPLILWQVAARMEAVPLELTHDPLALKNVFYVEYTVE